MSTVSARLDSPEGKNPPQPVPRLSLRENLVGLAEMRRDQLAFLVRSVRTHGDIFHMRLGGLPTVMVNHPDYLQHVLVDNHQNYDKDNFLYRATRTVLREGLIANKGGEPWRGTAGSCSPPSAAPASPTSPRTSAI